MEKQNFQLLMERQLESLKGGERLLLHSCCGPCSSYVLDVLTKHFDVTLLYYNPNIYPAEEYQKRLGEQLRLIKEMPTERPVSYMACEYDEGEFLQAAKGFEGEREGGARCEKCFRLRLKKTALEAQKNGFDYFTTTLSVSPHKNAQMLNQIGKGLEKEYGVKYLYADFKKKDGYKKSVKLSEEYNLYRQDYCGCRFALSQQKGG
ncbi:MAG: epoxyqueuosine reductase QueH [Acutalibacteraceae bacterium]